MKQKFEIEVEVGERISAHKLGLMIDSLEDIGGCYAKEIFIVDKPATKEQLQEYNKLRTAVINSYGVKNSPFAELYTKDLYPKVRNEINKIRRELVIKALNEVLPGQFNKRRYDHDPVGYSRFLAVELKLKGITINHYQIETGSGVEMPSDMCCIYQNDEPIHFFNYL